MDLKEILIFAGVDTSKGKAKQLLEIEEQPLGLLVWSNGGGAMIRITDLKSTMSQESFDLFLLRYLTQQESDALIDSPYEMQLVDISNSNQTRTNKKRITDMTLKQYVDILHIKAQKLVGNV